MQPPLPGKRPKGAIPNHLIKSKTNSSLLDSEVSIKNLNFVKRKEVLKFAAPLPGKRPKGAIPNHLIKY